MLFYSIAFLILLADQTLKFLVHKNMFLGQSLPLLGSFVKLTYVRNTGAAFSLFVGFSPYLLVVGIILSLIVIFLHYRIPNKDYAGQIGLALVLGGSLGNLWDRIFRGYVIDYIDLTFWPVFNLADIMINLGAIIIFFKFLGAIRETAKEAKGT